MRTAHNDGSLKNRIVLVTGATGNLGRPVVRRLIEAGDSVAAAIRDEARFKALQAFAGGPEGSLFGIMADVTSESDVGAMVDGLLRRCGRIDALLNLVGAYRGGADIAGTSDADWDFLMATNLKSAFLCSKAVLPAMIKAGRGRIVSVATRQALESKGRARSGAYTVSKAGIVVLTQVLAEETRKAGIAVNCIVPGTIDTPENRASIPGGDISRWTDPSDIAGVILFLLSGASSVVSGAAVPVYGKS
jgi:NAD(P)-dependent dehydrogenase (short-subunit alcohol dehydrogenase family)